MNLVFVYFPCYISGIGSMLSSFGSWSVSMPLDWAVEEWKFVTAAEFTFSASSVINFGVSFWCYVSKLYIFYGWGWTMRKISNVGIDTRTSVLFYYLWQIGTLVNELTFFFLYVSHFFLYPSMFFIFTFFFFHFLSRISFSVYHVAGKLEFNHRISLILSDSHLGVAALSLIVLFYWWTLISGLLNCSNGYSLIVLDGPP